MAHRIDLMGQRFGRLLVVGERGVGPDRKYRWNCLCDCGGQTACTTTNLRSERSKSCGCTRATGITPADQKDPCGATGCEKPVLARGWCNNHYSRYRIRLKSGWEEPIDPDAPIKIGRPPLGGDERKERVRARRKRYGNPAGLKARAKTREFIHAMKAVPCMDCGRTYPPCVMDFDHRPGEVKLFDISQYPSGSSEATLRAEIDKCDVVCSNCHRMRSWTRKQAKHV